MDDPVAVRIIAFLEGIGIAVRFDALYGDTFMPGLTVRNGAITVDRAKLVHPGDLLHEAGHIAVADPATRATLTTISDDPGEEMAAIAWSFAALRAIDIDPAIVFHADGYQGGSDAIIANFRNGQYFGVPLLEWFGMAISSRQAESAGVAPYPHMVRWLR